ncbi:MAG TPA: hypothetical protein VH012_00675 [Acidimicrobiales bacterium]|nr:hypothetical protein [Acidimicrobiales bacterium]
MVEARRLVVGALLAGASVVGAAAGVAGTAAMAGPAGADSTDAATLYKDAVATTHAWSVHYDSSSTEAKVTLVESGDAGPASASQSVTMGQGSISILVIGGISYVKGNADGLENLVGLSSSQATEANGQWIAFSTDNTAFAPVVEGVRSADLAKELALKAPLTLGKARTLHGEAVDAIDGTQAFGKKSQHVVLYVRAKGTHVPVEEDSVNAKGQTTDAEHITYSKWGERVRPEAPKATISVGLISAV